MWSGLDILKTPQQTVIEMLQEIKASHETTTTELKEEIKQIAPPQEPEVIINDSDIIPTPTTDAFKT